MVRSYIHNKNRLKKASLNLGFHDKDLYARGGNVLPDFGTLFFVHRRVLAGQMELYWHFWRSLDGLKTWRLAVSKQILSSIFLTWQAYISLIFVCILGWRRAWSLISDLPYPPPSPPPPNLFYPLKLTVLHIIVNHVHQ